MYLLKRIISPYTEADQVLGVFTIEEKAIVAKNQYVKQCKESDKWAMQAYRTVDLAQDVVVQDVTEIRNFNVDKIPDVVFVVSRFEDGFGQLFREVAYIFSSEIEAKKYIEAKETEPHEWEVFWYEIERLEIDKLYIEK